VPAERIAVVPLFSTGCVSDAIPPEPRRFSNRVLLVARLTELKGGRLLVAAMRLAEAQLRRPLTLVVAGAGPELPHIRRAAIAQGVSLEVAGWVDAQRRTELMRDADLLVVPGTWPEPFGLVGLEAACVGLPAAAFALGGITDWLAAGCSGELAPANPPTVTGLAGAIVRALHSSRHWQTLRVGAWTRSGLFSAQRHIDELELQLHKAAQC
jgi:glycosyltransferase involved in cell wall biosynthesis